MSKRNRERRKQVAEAKEEIEPSNYFDDKRDRFYGALLGASIAGLASMGLLGIWSILMAFAIGYFFWFAILFFGLNVPKKPIRLASKASKIGMAVGAAGFVAFVGILYLVLG